MRRYFHTLCIHVRWLVGYKDLHVSEEQTVVVPSPQAQRAAARVLRTKVDEAPPIPPDNEKTNEDVNIDEVNDDDDDFELSPDSKKKERLKNRKERAEKEKILDRSSDDSYSDDETKARKKAQKRKKAAAAKYIESDDDDKRRRKVSKRGNKTHKDDKSSSDVDKRRKKTHTRNKNPAAIYIDSDEDEKRRQKDSKGEKKTPQDNKTSSDEDKRRRKVPKGGNKHPKDEASSSDEDQSDASDESAPKPKQKRRNSSISAKDLKLKRLSGHAPDLQFASDVAVLEIWMRTAIHDFFPNEMYKHTVMFWSLKDQNSALRLLLKRHKRDLSDMITRYGGELRFLTEFGPHVKKVANNERAIQSKQIKMAFMSKQSPESRLVENMIEGELDANTDNPPRLHRTMQHLQTVEALRQLLISPNMYKDKILFDAFCTGIESGNFRQAKKRPYVPLNELITKAHEAHFRVELYYALSRKVYKHVNAPSVYKERVKTFNHVIQSVREGRAKWLEAALEERKNSLTDAQRDEFDYVRDKGNNSDDDVDLSENDM